MRLDLGLDWNPDTTDVWFTPPHIFKALNITFDLDPCAPPGGVPWIPATNHFSEMDDGLLQPWDGRIWLNPPYSNPRSWVKRLAKHGNGIALLPADTATSLWHDHIVFADALCFIRGRLYYVRRNFTTENNARFPSVLVGWGGVSAEAVRGCGLGWVP